MVKGNMLTAYATRWFLTFSLQCLCSSTSHLFTSRLRLICWLILKLANDLLIFASYYASYYAFVIDSLTWLVYFLSHDYLCHLIISFTRFFIYFLFLYDEGQTLETLDFTVCIGNTPTFSFFDSYIYSTYAAHYVYLTKITSLCMPCECLYLNGYPSYHININIYIITRISRHDYMF